MAIDQSRVPANSHFNNNYKILYLLFTVSFAQMIIILLLVLETPIRNHLLARLDELKRSRAQLAVKSIAFVLMIHSVSVIIRNRSLDAVNSPNHVVKLFRLLEASLLGFSLILLVTIEGLHKYIKEHVMVQETIRATKKQNRAYENCMKKNADEAEIIRKDISRLKTEITNLESECSAMEQAAQLQRADSSMLKNTLEGVFEKYDQLLTYNKDLKDQLQGANERLSCSDGRRSAFFSWDRWGI
ncbi:hypothetical protein QVD17_25786 [Tagetes erecta]|uniref:Endoplasmic reticulum transmembrane protein n=1 Tax=Tagetes erecta TaxID=13708 RepID=A0AAD8NQ58_TARER|nr:hypothetical protein QVD17_25786 [Tagetes erecta]